MENYKLKKKRIIFESIYKNERKTVTELGDIKIEKKNFHLHKRPLCKIYKTSKQRY